MAIAGSILYLYKTRGIIVPIVDANTITVNKEILTTIPSFVSPKTRAKQNKIVESNIPFNKPIKVSYKILLTAPSNSLFPRAKD